MSQYLIKATRHFFGPDEKVGYYVSDHEYFGDRVRARRMSLRDAQELQERLDLEEYWLSSGESGRPSYEIVRA